VVSYRLSIVTIALSLSYQFSHNLPSNVSDTEVNGGWVDLGQTFGEEGVGRCKPNFDTIWERQGAVVRR